jgi:hypothetical protein
MKAAKAPLAKPIVSTAQCSFEQTYEQARTAGFLAEGKSNNISRESPADFTAGNAVQQWAIEARLRL